MGAKTREIYFLTVRGARSQVKVLAELFLFFGR